MLRIAERNLRLGYLTIYFSLITYKMHVCLSLASLACILTRVTSPPNPNTGGFRLIFSVSFSYFLFFFYLPRYILSHFLSVSPLASLPFLPCCHWTTTTCIMLVLLMDVEIIFSLQISNKKVECVVIEQCISRYF